MSANANHIDIPDSKQSAFKALTVVPNFAWPTIMLAIVASGSVIVVDALALMGVIGIWSAFVLNCIAYYLFFSVIHDSAHHSLGRNRGVNEFFGQLALSLSAPYANLAVFRYAHMEHHRFTNDDGDPDIWFHGAWWTLPFRWITIDFYYAFRLIQSENPKVKEKLKKSIPVVAGGLVFLIALLVAGYWKELLLLWLLPTRIAFIGIGFSFFWLPHVHWPDPERNLKQSDNPTLATAVREDYPAFFTPVFACQNFHLIHHLWPTTPFYNNRKLWLLVEDELRQRDLAIQRGFSIQPEYVLANGPQNLPRSG